MSVSPATLAELLASRGLAEPGTLAVRTALHPADRCADLPSSRALVAQGLVAVYERMQDGPAFGQTARIVSFAPEAGGRARLAGLRRVFARRPGVVPGDIVYDYDAAGLLHGFISRANAPVFYDAVDEEGLDDLGGRLVVAWPKPARRIRAADDPRIEIVET